MSNNDLITENINFLNDYIPKLICAIEQEIEYIANNDETNAFQLLESIIEGFVWTIRSIRSLENLGYIKNIKIDETNKFLNETIESFQKKDFVLLTDLLQYELIEVLSDWKKKVKSIKGTLN